MSIQSLPTEITTQIISYVICDQISNGNGPTIASVCKQWKGLLEADFLWKPYHQDTFSSRDYRIARMTYPHDIPKDASMKEQVRIATGVIKKMKMDFRKYLKNLSGFDFENLMSRLSIKPTISIMPGTNTIRFETPQISEMTYDKDITTSCFFDCIKSKMSAEQLAKALLFNPATNANTIAKELSKNRTIKLADFRFIIELLIKLHYDLTDFFTSLNDDQKEMIISFAIGGELDITLSDYVQSGCAFSSLERNTKNSSSNYSMLLATLRTALNCYPERKFSLKGLQEMFGSSSFKDERLVSLKRKQPFSENDLIQFLRDLMFNCKLNLDIKVSGMGMDRVPEGSAIARFEWITHNCPFLPKNNAFKVVLDEYKRKQ
jgi:hypothetical protein